MAKNKKLDKLSQVHGQAAPEVKKPIDSLDKLLGFTGKEKYGTLDEDVYVADIEKLDIQALRFEATKRGIIPVVDTKRLKKSLLTKFREHAHQFGKVAKKPKSLDNMTDEERVLSMLDS